MSTFCENVEKLEHHKITINLTTRMHSSRMRTVRCSGRRGGGGVCIPACTGQGVCIPVCTGWGGVSQHALGRGCLPRGVCAQGGCVCRGGVCLPRRGVYIPAYTGQGGVYPSACWDTPPPMNRILDTRL